LRDIDIPQPSEITVNQFLTASSDDGCPEAPNAIVVLRRATRQNILVQLHMYAFEIKSTAQKIRLSIPIGNIDIRLLVSRRCSIFPEALTCSSLDSTAQTQQALVE
jgi:hypothetical protein